MKVFYSDLMKASYLDAKDMYKCGAITKDRLKQIKNECLVPIGQTKKNLERASEKGILPPVAARPAI
ncbi:hypothetical protein FACS189494_09360 [Spirochaetia bacterium]|nr:hypothetical protein FACS189494_09360 [Spirochaetia bacterium]